jgi:DNA-binding beta-propeller fold protein YncE
VGVVVRPDGRQVWVANSDRFKGGVGSLSMVSPAGGAQRREASGKFPRDIGFLPDGKTLVVAQYDSKAIQFVPTD